MKRSDDEVTNQNGASEISGTAVAVTRDPVMNDLADTLASGIKSSADWIRDADLEKLKDDVVKQVKKHPARSLLVALGAGFLLGKALRR